MKKTFFMVIFISFALQSKSQFLNSIGITGGVSYGNQNFYFSDPALISRKKYILGYNGSLFFEFFSNNHARWVTEIQYNEKGSVDKQTTGNSTNKLQYICWNNYLKLRYEMFRIIPYILLGPRLEYDLTQQTSSVEITKKFIPLHVSPAVGAGVEFVSYGNIKFFIEGFYNPDLIGMPAYVTDPLTITNKNFELRVGLKYQFEGRVGSCNTPIYDGD